MVAFLGGINNIWAQQRQNKNVLTTFNNGINNYKKQNTEKWITVKASNFLFQQACSLPHLSCLKHTKYTHAFEHESLLCYDTSFIRYMVLILIIKKQNDQSYNASVQFWYWDFHGQWAKGLTVVARRREDRGM